MAGRLPRSDADYCDPVPGGASQAPVSGDQFKLHARGCTAQIGGSARRPPTVGIPTRLWKARSLKKEHAPVKTVSLLSGFHRFASGPRVIRPIVEGHRERH
jgi:hypothetical protein